MDKIILYSTHCPKCKVVEKKLMQANIQYEIVDAKQPEIIEMLFNKGHRQMPVLEVNGEMKNFSEIIKWIGVRPNGN